MKNNLRDKFREFLASEEGRVGVKAPLTVGVVGGSLLLAQAIFSPDAQADIECSNDGNCGPKERCDQWQELEWDPNCGCQVWVWHAKCVAN